MKQMLLFSVFILLLSTSNAQQEGKQKATPKRTAYAITGVQKGANAWTEVRLVDVATGEEVQTVFKSADEAELLNARTGKPLAQKTDVKGTPTVSKPFATASAACAYDKKHNRLYYTPMGIAQLRYIDLKAKTPKVFYFEDEAFGVVQGRHDVAAQITRMAMGGDGYGYALSNDGTHLIQFTTGKKPVITDLGPLTDGEANDRYSIHGSSMYGGDMIADKKDNLYLITANRAVFRIGINSKVANYLGQIKDLPRGFSTNGAVALGDSRVLVSSSGSTQGYYAFDLKTLEAEKVSNGASVFNASDLASASFAFEKKEGQEEVAPPAEEAVVAARQPINVLLLPTAKAAISVYPNPVTDGMFRLTFANQLPGRYSVQLLDLSGKVISTQFATVSSKGQVAEIRIPQTVSAGTYFVKVANGDGSFTNTQKIVVQ